MARYIYPLLPLFIMSLLAGTTLQAQLRLQTAYPNIGGNSVEVKWAAVPGAQEYEYRRKENNGAYSAWISAGLNTTVNDGMLTAASTYTYQVRVKVGGVITDTSNEKKTGFTRTWPVRKAGDCTTESVELLHGFGQPIGGFASAPTEYFHEGIDIQGESAVNNECVKAPMGAIVLYHGGAGSNIAVNLQVNLNGTTRYIQFNHLKSLNASLVDGETVAPGDSLGLIADGIWSTLTSHTHCHFWSTYADLFGTAINPFNIWDNNTYRDPQGNNPQVINTNGDEDSLRFRKTPGSSDYFPANGKVHNGVDIVVEAVDKESSDAPWQVPKIVGYFIQRQENTNWVDAVKTTASPYVLVDNNIYYQSSSSSGNPAVVNTIIDFRNALRSMPPATPKPGYDFEQWFTYIVTNTKGTTGAAADLDSNQHWATDARKTVAEDNGFKTGYDKARAVDEAKFPDGKYRINIRLEDFVNKAPDFQREIMVDNFRPYAKKVEIKSGKLNYKAEWEWDAAAGKLTLKDNVDTNKAAGKITIRITASEPMKDMSIEIPTLSFSKNSTTPVANTEGKTWEFEVPAANLNGAKEGPHKILIDGHDIAGNALQGFVSKGDKTDADLQKRLLDSTWKPANAPVKDTIHAFKVETKVDIEFVIDDTGSMGEEIDGVKNSILQILALPIFAVDTLPYKFQLTTFKDNVTTRASTFDLNVIKNQVSALFAGGGGDCPEASVEAIDAIKDSVKRGGIVFLATDASPHAGLDYAGVAAALNARGISLSVILSGDCSGSFLAAAAGSGNQTSTDAIPYSDNHDRGTTGTAPAPGLTNLSPNPTAIEAFSFLAQETGGLFAFVPEINKFDRTEADIARYVNIAFNLILGALVPAISNVEPGSGPVGGTLALTITGARTSFNATTTISFGDTGIVVKELKVLSPTQLQSTVAIGTAVPLGFKDIKTSTELGGGNIDTASGKGLLQVTAAPTAPTILSISPTSGGQGRTLPVKVTGINTHFTNASVLSIGSGIAVLNSTALSSTELQATIRIDSTAVIGFRDVRVTTGSEIATENVTGPFLVTAPITDTSACNLSALTAGPDRTVNLFYADSSCVVLSVSGFDSALLAGYKITWSTGDTTPAIRVCPDAAKLYTVTVVNGSCIFKDTVAVQVIRCPRNIVVKASSCTEKATISWTEPGDTYPASFSAPKALDPGAGNFAYVGSYDGHGYYRSANTYLWPVARDLSGYLGGAGVNGHLATITSAGENNFIHHYISSAHISPWIGLFSAGRLGRFRWVGGEALSYTNWAAGEPNNYGGTPGNVVEPYVQIYENGTWNDASSVGLPFLLEFEKPLIRYKQISGPKNGSAQKPGVYLVCYERTNLITDQKDTCCFSVTVTCGPVSTGACPKDTVIYAASCTEKTLIKWNEPVDTFPATYRAPVEIDPGSGSHTFIGSLDGHGYYRSMDTYLWPVARDVARLVGGAGVNGHLVTIASAAENDFIYNYLKTAHIAPWIGLFNTGRAGRFRWVGGEDLDYTNWAPGEPNNYGGTPDNIVEPYVRIYDNGTWNDESNINLPFITEFEKPLIRYRQISGPKNGSEQKPGVYIICYEKTNLITDEKDTCCFSITVTCNPSLAEEVEAPLGDRTAQGKAVQEAGGLGLQARVRPNPSSTQFTIDITGNGKERVSLQAWDVLGRVVEKRDGLLLYQPVRIGENYKPGIYFVQLTQGTKKVMLKMVKQSK
ncbi:MAG: T9SS type A sorting domain-containing protein [Williamsia sp.]|nr:T9SS type A sorting domain-containing protein [Williamsia sp.]